jgi:hypothetical protein
MSLSDTTSDHSSSVARREAAIEHKRWTIHFVRVDSAEQQNAFVSGPEHNDRIVEDPIEVVPSEQLGQAAETLLKIRTDLQRALTSDAGLSHSAIRSLLETVDRGLAKVNGDGGSPANKITAASPGD